MLSPSNEDCICAMFDSFCKTVSRNFVRNLDRADGKIHRVIDEDKKIQVQMHLVDVIQKKWRELI